MLDEILNLCNIAKGIIKIKDNRYENKVKEYLEKTRGTTTNLDEIMNNIKIDEDNLRNILLKLENEGYIINHCRDLDNLDKEIEFSCLQIH